MSAPAHDYTPVPEPDDLGEAVAHVEAALLHLEDAVLARVTRKALAEAAETVPWDQVKAEAGL